MLKLSKFFAVEKEEEVVITDDENDEEEVSRKNGRNHSHFHVENLFIQREISIIIPLERDSKTMHI